MKIDEFSQNSALRAHCANAQSVGTLPIFPAPRAIGSSIRSTDRTNTVAYNSDWRVANVTDFSGRTVTYKYYHGLPGEPGGPGDLASVTSPPVIGTPSKNDFPFGKTT